MPEPTEPEAAEHVEVIVVGAGLSGIGTACHLQRSLPDVSYVILESRDTSGGTWDLFRYPGLRSDSDMFTLGYSFNPWRSPVAIAEGAAILRYVRETAEAFGVDSRIRYRQRVVSASWSQEKARWTVRIAADGKDRTMSCDFLYLNTGYYDYADPYRPEFTRQSEFTGELIHPQLWPRTANWDDQDVVVIGSGATAVTLAPALAPRARSVVMLQRSPGYVISLPRRNTVAERLFRWFPPVIASRLERARSAGVVSLMWHVSRIAPRRTARWLVGRVRHALPHGYPVREHFTPSYRPWDQRLCVAPDGDLFTAVAAGDVEMVTGRIAALGERSVELDDGRSLPADLIVLATGLRVKMLGGIALDLDGEPVVPADTVLHKGTMLSGVPNLAVSVGYANASWTLKIELSARLVVRTLRYMRWHGYRVVVASPPPTPGRVPLMSLMSGYLRRAEGLPTQGRHWPWRMVSSYWVDAALMRAGRLHGRGIHYLR
ncbi:flavin-containing monooxygenase [Kineosporia succinea]|uniref:Cation diffusion facilitator CzcD-associated flavoprotein CzcO n=1 Tax=Kineosporia succinea TaxID=84632 RepID=A0ABT9P520_9ACTN|nr:NAD(P)/FAD-dependent oxidoreductase [Kineosporia succinea]MDP9827796.1 cation diffusion facilitator CzcD-associated flavoprotein CzcO [Kineosporia succinea]